jgi:hypothetical protein
MVNRSMIAWLLGCVLVLTRVAYAADPAWSDLKLGLWEMTVTSKNSGQVVPAIPEDSLKHLPPDRRKELLEKLADAGKLPDTTSTTVKTCVTPAKLRDNMSDLSTLRDAFAQDCQMHTVSSAASETTTTGTCNLGALGTMSVESHTKVVSREAYTVIATVVTSIGPQTVRAEMETKAKWLGSNCGDVKD